MKENFLHFLSHVACSIYVNGKHIGVIDNKNVFELDILTKTGEVLVTYEPICGKEKYIPYSIYISTNQTPTCESDYVDIIPFPDDNYDIVLKPFMYNGVEKPQVLVNQIIDKYYISILSLGNTQITIYSGASIVFKDSIPLLKKASVECINSVIVIKGIIDKNTYYLMLIDSSNLSLLHSDICQSISVTNEEIEALKYLDNIPQHAEVCKIQLKSKTKEIFYVYKNGKPRETICKYLIPKAFLDGLKVNDENLCKSLLSNNLSNSNLSKFKSFFGDINKVYFNRHSSTPNINYTILSSEYKNYDFILEDNKIIEIEEK